MSWKKQQQIALDRSPDYEAFRNNITLDKPIQDPRNEIFASLGANVVQIENESHHKTNSCPVPPDTRPKVVKHIINTNSCPSPVYYHETGIEKNNHGVIKESIENNEVQDYVDSSDIEGPLY